MTLKREILGLWWLPTDPGKRWSGTLSLEHGKSPNLTVTVLEGFRQGALEFPAVVQGYNDGGIPISLLYPGCARRYGGLALSQMDFSAGYAILGMQLANPSELKVNTLILRVQHLFEWSGITGFTKEANTGNDYRINYHRPENLSFTIDSDLTVELGSAHSFEDGWRGKNLEEDMAIIFKSKQGLNFAQIREYMTAIRHLLHFAVLKRVYLTNILAQKDDQGRNYGERFVPDDIEIWTSIIEERVESEILSERWIFQFNDVKRDFGDFFGKWLKFLRDFSEAIDCYSTTIYHQLPHEVEYLCLTQALDAYHGIKFTSHHDNQFEGKVLELAQIHAASLTGLVDDAADFATIVQHNRNYYTHHNPYWKTQGRVLSGSDLYRLIEKLRLLFQMCVLSEIGIPAERYVRLRRQLAIKLIHVD